MDAASPPIFAPDLTGALQFEWGTGPIDRLIQLVTGGPNHVRVILNARYSAEMTMRGFALIETPPDRPSGLRRQTINLALTPQQRQHALDYALARRGTRYAFLSCFSDLLNRMGCPLTLGVIGQENCSMFAAAADCFTDWETATPASLYEVATRGESPQ